MNPNVEPCDDFYKFACGGFLDNTIIPDDKTTVNTFSNIVDNLEEQLRSSIEEESFPDEPRSFKLAKNFYKACMNKSKQFYNNFEKYSKFKLSTEIQYQFPNTYLILHILNIF